MEDLKEALPIAPPEDVNLKKEMDVLWQEYLQKCCEVGQIRYQLEQLDSQQREIEKQLEVTERGVRSVANKHRELQKANMEKIKLSNGATQKLPEPKLEMAEASH